MSNLYDDMFQGIEIMTEYSFLVNKCVINCKINHLNKLKYNVIEFSICWPSVSDLYLDLKM